MKKQAIITGIISFLIILFIETYRTKDKVLIITCVAILIPSVCIIVFILSRRLWKWNDLRKYRIQDESGIWQFIDKIMQPAESGWSPEDMDSVFWTRIVSNNFASSRQKKEVRGVICGEEVTGIAENGKCAVTVTKPETAKMFRGLPKKWQKRFTVTDLSET